MKLPKHDVEDCVYNIDNFVNLIEKFPQTYNTFFRARFFISSTLQTILRRKVSKLSMKGKLFCAKLPGFRSKIKIFYHPDKKYRIVVIGVRVGVEVITYSDFIETDGGVILDDYWVLDSYRWVKGKKSKVVKEGDVLKLL